MADSNSSFDTSDSPLEEVKQPEIVTMSEEQVRDMFSAKNFQRLADKYHWTEEQKEGIFYQNRMWATQISSHLQFRLDRAKSFLKISSEDDTKRAGCVEE